MKKNGFSIVEMLISVTILVVVGGLLMSILVNNTKVVYHESTKVTDGIGANDSTLSMMSSIRGASAIVAGYPVDSPTYTTDDTHLVLKLPSVDTNGDTIPDTFDYIVYYKDSDKIRLKTFPSLSPVSKRYAEDKILTFNVADLKFEYFNKTGPVSPTSATKVRVNFTLSEKTTVQEAELRND